MEMPALYINVLMIKNLNHQFILVLFWTHLSTNWIFLSVSIKMKANFSLPCLLQYHLESVLDLAAVSKVSTGWSYFPLYRLNSKASNKNFLL